MSDSSPIGLVLFDGECVFCDGFVQWLLARDPSGRLRFAPLQGETAAELRIRHPEIPQDHDTVVFVELTDREPRVALRSDAALRTLSLVESPWRHANVLRFVPAVLRDLPYRLFVRLRYRLFGRYDTCPIPTPDVAQRFLA